MRIAEVLLRPAIGGAETLVEHLRRHWVADGHDVETFYVADTGEPPGKVARVRRLADAFRTFGPDVVHAHSALPNLYARVAGRGRWPVVTVLHSAGRDFDVASLRYAEKALGRWTSHVIAVSPAQVAEYRMRFGSRVPVSLVPNGVRADIVARAVPADRPARAVAVGRLDPQKRIDLLVEGWLRADLPGARLRIAGVASEAPMQRQVEEWVAGADTVELLGSVSDVPGLLAMSDLFVHAADQEAHPLAPIEAACAGLPIVVTDEVAASLPAGLPAVTFPGGSAGGLQVALHTAFESYAEMAGAAIEKVPGVAAEFSMPRCADRHLNILRASSREASLIPGRT